MWQWQTSGSSSLRVNGCKLEAYKLWITHVGLWKGEVGKKITWSKKLSIRTRNISLWNNK